MTVAERDVDLSIVIVNWHSTAYLRRCIRSITEHTRKPTYEIVVVDSGSFDGCEQMLCEEFPDVRFVQCAGNVGFARANNHAYRDCRGDCILFLNPDTELVNAAVDCLYASLMSLPDAGIFGCKLLNPDGSIQLSCVQSMPTIANQLLDSNWLRRLWPQSRLWGMSALFESGDHLREVEAVSGACLMIKRDTFEEVGRFSEDYFMYAEDIDLAFKVRGAGYKNYYAPTATVIHYGGSSSAQAVTTFAAVMMRDSVWRFFCRTRGKVYGVAYRAAMLFAAVARLAALQVILGTGWRRSSVAHSCRKWRAVLLWSLNRDQIVKDYRTV